MPNNATSVTEPAETFEEKLSDTATQAKEKVSDMGRAAVDKIDDKREAAAGGLDRAAETLHEKAEIREEALKARISGALLGTGALVAVFAVFFLLFTAYQTLALVLSAWAALASIAAFLLTAGVKRLKQIHPAPELTIETIKENVEWAKQQVK